MIDLLQSIFYGFIFCVAGLVEAEADLHSTSNEKNTNLGENLQKQWHQLKFLQDTNNSKKYANIVHRVRRWLDNSHYIDKKWLDNSHYIDKKWLDGSQFIDKKWLDNSHFIDKKQTIEEQAPDKRWLDNSHYIDKKWLDGSQFIDKKWLDNSHYIDKKELDGPETADKKWLDNSQYIEKKPSEQTKRWLDNSHYYDKKNSNEKKWLDNSQFIDKKWLDSSAFVDKKNGNDNLASKSHNSNFVRNLYNHLLLKSSLLNDSEKNKLSGLDTSISVLKKWLDNSQFID